MIDICVVLRCEMKSHARAVDFVVYVRDSRPAGSSLCLENATAYVVLLKLLYDDLSRPKM